MKVQCLNVVLCGFKLLPRHYIALCIKLTQQNSIFFQNHDFTKENKKGEEKNKKER